MDKKTRQRIEAFIATLQERSRSLQAIEADRTVKDEVDREASGIGILALDMEEWLDEERQREKRASRMAVVRGVLSFLLLAGLLALNVYVFRENSLAEEGDYLKVIQRFFPNVGDPMAWAGYLKLAVAGCLGLMSFLLSLIAAMVLEVVLKAVRLPMNSLVFALLAGAASGVILYYYLEYFDVLKATLYRFV